MGASNGDEVAALQKRLTEELTKLVDNTETSERVRGRATWLRSRVIRTGPTPYTVSQAAYLTGISTVDYLHMTADNDWPGVTPSSVNKQTSPTLATAHIFDTAAAQQIGSDIELLAILQRLNLVEPTVTETVIEHPHVRKTVARAEMEQWLKVSRTNDIASMQSIEAIRLYLVGKDQRDEYPDPLRRLARAESLAIALDHADRNEPVRVITAGPQSSARYEQFGLASTSVWHLLAEAFNENRLDHDMAGPLREIRQKTDVAFEPRISSWPRNPPTLPKPPGIIPG